MRPPFSITCYCGFLAGCMFALTANAPGATRIAASPSQPEVEKTIDAAADGDTVRLSEGTATWTASVTVTGKFITIQGAGIDKTTIVGGDYAPSSRRPTHRVFDDGDNIRKIGWPACGEIDIMEFVGHTPNRVRDD